LAVASIPNQDPRIYVEDTDLDLPKVLDNRTRYLYFKKVAQGGTCVISSCFDMHLRRTIAYKALRKELADDLAEQKRFVREARVTAMLQHPNTIPTYELGRDGSRHVYFTMKLVHGRTLRAILDDCMKQNSHNVSHYSLQRLIYILSQTGHALHYAHNHGVIHRDIKPENILIGSYGEVLVLDWGMAKVWSKDPDKVHTETFSKFKRGNPISADGILQTELQNLHGTPPYVSPEQLEREPNLDHTTDIYSFGALLYEILSLTRMIPGDTVNQVLDFIRNNEIASPVEKTELELPEELVNLCMRCVDRDPANRPQSLENIITRLENWLNLKETSEMAGN